MEVAVSKFLSDLYSISYKRDGSPRSYTEAVSFLGGNNIEISGNIESQYKQLTIANNLIFPEVKEVASSVSESVLSKSQISGSSLQQDFHIEVPRLVSNVLGYLVAEEYIDGEISKTHLYLDVLREKYPVQFPDVFQQVWLRLFRDDALRFRNFICIAAGLNYNYLKDRADALVLGAFAHMDEDVNEAGIRAVESWGVSSHYYLLSKLRPFNDPFLEEYRVAVLADLKGGI